MHCIVHIGTEKTATTSFQKYFRINRNRAERQGVWYPESLGLQWHRDLAVYCMNVNDPDDAFRAHGIDTQQKHEAFCSELEERFAAEFSVKKDMPFCLISSEHFHSRLKTPNMVSRLETFLRRFFDQITVVVHLRPQIDMMVSLASTVARGDQIVGEEFFALAKLDSTYYDYDRLLGMWETVFKRDALRVVPFKRMPNLTTVIAQISNSRVDQFGELSRENAALDVEVIALLNVVKRNGAKVGNIAPILNDLPLRNRIQIPRGHAERLVQRCRASNQRIVDRYPDLTLSDLEPDLSSYPEQGNLHLLDADCALARAVTDFFSRSRRVFLANTELRRKLNSAQ